MSDETAAHGPREHDSTAVVMLAAGAGTRFRDDRHIAGDDPSDTAGDDRADVDLDVDGDVDGDVEAVIERPHRHKLLAELPATADRPAEAVVSRAIATAIEADVGEVIVVTGAVELPLPPSVLTCENPEWAQGQMTSVRAGIAAAAARGHHRVLIGLADQPGIEPGAWRAVAEHDGPIVVATYAGRRGNPVRLDEEVWELLPAGGDEGARVLMRNSPNLVREVPCTGSPADIDTVEDLRQWQSN